MVTTRLTKAMKDDPEIVRALEEAKLPNDAFMKAKMRAVDAMESQRHINTTRQWTAFSTSGSQLDEGTRNVKASIGTTHQKELETRAQTGKKDSDITEEVTKLRKEGGKEAEGLLDERDLLEARFKDTQATFKAISDLLFTLLAQGLVIGLSMGLAAPLSIGIQIAITVGIELLRAAYKHFVLGEDDLLGIGVDFVMGVVAGTVKACTGNIAMALNSSLLHPTTSGLPQWFGTATSKAIGGLINQTVMFAPEHFKAKAMQEKALEKVIKEGEDDIGDAAVEYLKKAGKGVVTKLVMGLGKELGQDVTTAIKGEEPTQQPRTAVKTTDDAFRDAFSGGSNQARVVAQDGTIVARGEDALRMQQNGTIPPGSRLENTTGSNGLSEEQEQRWKRLEKQQKKETKKQAKGVIKTMKGHVNEKALEKDRHKLRVKEIKGDDKEAKSPELKKILEAIEGDKKAGLAQLVRDNKITVDDLSKLNEEEREKVEEEANTFPGHVDQLVSRLLPKGK